MRLGGTIFPGMDDDVFLTSSEAGGAGLISRIHTRAGGAK